MTYDSQRERNKVAALLEISDIPKDSRMYRHIVDIADEYRGFNHVRDCLYFLPLMEMSYPRLCSSIVLGFRSYPELEGNKSFSTLPEDVVQRCIALALVTESLESLSWADGSMIDGNPVDVDKDGGRYLSEGELKELVLSCPGEAKRISHIIRERRVVDVESIGSLLNESRSVHVSLAEGVL